MMSHSLYDVLGIPKNATQEQIKQAYRTKAKEFHPDKPGGSEEKIKEINLAYEILSDEERRANYDKTGRITKEGTFEEMFEQFISHIFVSIICDTPTDVLGGIDMIKELRSAVSRLITVEVEQKRKFENKKLKVEKVLLNLREGNGVIEIALQKQIGIFEHNIDMLDESVKFLNQCQEQVRKYGYSFNEMFEGRNYIGVSV